MKEIILKRFNPIILVLILLLGAKVYGQTGMPEELTTRPMQDQLKWLEDRTRIYENFRAIREDIFQKVKNNVTDSLRADDRKITELTGRVSALNQKIDSLENTLQETKTNLDDMTNTKNSIRVLGMNVNKLTYNSIIWTIIAGLIILLILGLVVFKRNQAITLNTQKELKDLKDEFEEYRKTTRIAREKMTMDHFNEIKKLRGG